MNRQTVESIRRRLKELQDIIIDFGDIPGSLEEIELEIANLNMLLEEIKYG